MIAYLRKGKSAEDQLLMLCNFTPLPREKHAVGIHEAGDYREVFNSDSQFYGGSNFGNQGLLKATAESTDGRDWRLQVNLPPLGAVILKKEG